MYNSCGPEKKLGKMGVAVYLAVLGIFAAAIVACGVGKAHGNRQNVAASHSETKTVEAAESFPMLWAQSGNGMEDVAELHLREDLALENYSWVEPYTGGADAKVRIPIERAMELLAQRGLPLAAPAMRPARTLSGEEMPKIVLPLTNGFALTSYDLNLAAEQARDPRR